MQLDFNKHNGFKSITLSPLNYMFIVSIRFLFRRNFFSKPLYKHHNAKLFGTHNPSEPALSFIMDYDSAHTVAERNRPGLVAEVNKVKSRSLGALRQIRLPMGTQLRQCNNDYTILARQSFFQEHNLLTRTVIPDIKDIIRGISFDDEIKAEIEADLDEYNAPVPSFDTRNISVAAVTDDELTTALQEQVENIYAFEEYISEKLQKYINHQIVRYRNTLQA